MAFPELPDPDLREALRRLAAADAPEVLERARRRARKRAERLIEEALLQELLAAADRRELFVAGERETGVGDERERPVAGADERLATGADQRLAAGADQRLAAGPDPSAEPETQPPAPTAQSVDDAWWTYCITWAEDAGFAVSGLEGIEPGSRVEAVCDGELAALVSRVPLDEYGDERLREHLEDLEWLERIARGHERVLEAVLADATVVPLRLCTVYRTTDGVRRLLHENRAALREGLIQVAACVEWGVKVFADPSAHSIQDGGGSPTTEARGTGYLLRRQHERALAERASEVRARCAQVVHQQLGALARASTTNPPQRPEVHGRELTMLLNAAYLIERDRAAEVQAALTSLQGEWSSLGFVIELTGPWPPYNFVFGVAGMLT